MTAIGSLHISIKKKFYSNRVLSVGCKFRGFLEQNFGFSGVCTEHGGSGQVASSSPSAH